MDTITDTKALDALCARLAPQPYITVDTEFLRDGTYYSKLCLIQVADEEGAFIIDPLADGLDLASFWSLMNDAPCIKVFHASRQDVEICFQATGKIPTPIFDTQIAGMVCGFGDSVGYETLVARVCNERLDKTQRFTDWSRRPLSRKQLEYAIGDVTHLRTIYKYLDGQLRESGRGEWIEGELAILTSPSTYEIDPDMVWKRLKTRSRNRQFLGRVQTIARWREYEAQNRNLPRNRVMRDDAILELAAHPPESPDDLNRIRGISNGFSRSRAGRAVFEALENDADRDPGTLPELDEKDGNKRRKPGPMLELLRMLVRIKAQQHGVAQKMLSNAADLEKLYFKDKPDIPSMQGWRYEVFGRDAEALKRGELAIAADGDDITVFSRDPTGGAQQG